MTQNIKTERTASRLRHCMAWLIHMCAMTYAYSWRETRCKDGENTFSSATLPDMTYLCVCHDSCVFVTWYSTWRQREQLLNYDTAWHDSFMCDMIAPWLIYIRVMIQDVKTEGTASRLRHCMTWLLRACAMTCFYMCVMKQDVKTERTASRSRHYLTLRDTTPSYVCYDLFVSVS